MDDTGSNRDRNNKKKKKKKKKKTGGAKKKMTMDQIPAFKSVNEWVNLAPSSPFLHKNDDFLPKIVGKSMATTEKLVFELHAHSTCSDGFLSPSALVENAHQNGVKVLALTDHDTMAGIPEAVEAARKYGMKIIPGVEISTVFSPRGDSSSEEPVHILAYYGSCGPSDYEHLDEFLAGIREGRYGRARNIISKLNRLKMPLKWEHVTRIAGHGVAPGRLHVARALVEAGHVETLKQAFDRYLYDGGPAYSRGSELYAEKAVQLVCKTGGMAVLAHPWALKNVVPIIKRLKAAGLHGIEVFRSDGKLAVYNDLADTYGLVKLGGSDYHGRGSHGESPLGSVSLPILAIRDFLDTGRPIWCDAIRNILERYVEDPSESNLQPMAQFQDTGLTKGGQGSKERIQVWLSSWLSREEMQQVEFQATVLKLSNIAV